MAFRLPVSGFDRVTGELREQGYAVISEVNHRIARMVFFDTYQTLGVTTETMALLKKDGLRSNKCKKAREDLFNIVSLKAKTST